mgnify:CR=1 FL=1
MVRVSGTLEPIDAMFDGRHGEFEAAPLWYLFMHEGIEQGVQALEGRFDHAMWQGAGGLHEPAGRGEGWLFSFAPSSPVEPAAHPHVLKRSWPGTMRSSCGGR